MVNPVLELGLRVSAFDETALPYFPAIECMAEAPQRRRQHHADFQRYDVIEFAGLRASAVPGRKRDSIGVLKSKRY